MEDKTISLESLFTKVEVYSKTTIEIIELQIIEKSADLLSHLASKFVIFITLTMVALTLNIGVALWISDTLGYSCSGFLILGGFYSVVTLLIFIFQKHWIKTPVSNSIITQLLKQRAL